MSRPYTVEEVQHKFISHVHNTVEYWLNNSRAETAKEKLEGLAFSVLSAIDGSAAALPSFALIPAPHPDDMSYHAENGDNYYPPFRGNINDISGSLHELYSKLYKGV